MSRHLDLLHKRHAGGERNVNVNAVHQESLGWLDRIALFITERIGTFGTFLLIVGWTVFWLGWNILAPVQMRFDPAPAFVFWLFISNLIQISLMPLLMTGQGLQSRHAELQVEQSQHMQELTLQELGEMKNTLALLKLQSEMRLRKKKIPLELPAT